VAVDGDDGIVLDITGCAHLFGGEAGLIADLERRVRGFDVAIQAACADTPAAAWAWSRFGARFGDGPILPPETARTRLAPLPMEALRLPPDIVETLRRLGLRRIGDVMDMPRGPLAARFGDILLQRLDTALGHAEPISPRRPTPLWRARIQFADGIGRREDIDAALRQLLDELCRAMETDGRGARRLELGVYRLDGTAQFVTIGTSRPTHDAKHLARLFAEKLGTIDPGFGIETMILGALATDPLAIRQVDLAADAARTPEDLAAFVDRLQNRLGAGTVTRLAPVASYVPERAVATQPATGPVRGSWPKGRPRPIRLLAVPEAVEAVGVPGEPPRRFRWRHVEHRIAEAEGPERLSPEWWRTPAHEIRDYYWLQDAEGRRFWVYRLATRDTPAWYLHGLFA
jgi:protein ImuB